jgi:hypothetical protein
LLGLRNLFHPEVQEDLVKPVVELVSVSVEEVGFSDLHLVVVPGTGGGNHALVSIGGHVVLKNSQVLEGVQSVAIRLSLITCWDSVGLGRSVVQEQLWVSTWVQGILL